MRILIFSFIASFLFLGMGLPAAQAVTSCPAGFEVQSGVCVPINTGLPDSSGVTPIVQNFLQWLLGIFGLIAIIAFIISGVQYLTAAGDERQIETAKRTMTWSIIGVIVGLMGYIIVLSVDSALRSHPFF